MRPVSHVSFILDGEDYTITEFKDQDKPGSMFKAFRDGVDLFGFSHYPSFQKAYKAMMDIFQDILYKKAYVNRINMYTKPTSLGSDPTGEKFEHLLEKFLDNDIPINVICSSLVDDYLEELGLLVEK